MLPVKIIHYWGPNSMQSYDLWEQTEGERKPSEYELMFLEAGKPSVLVSLPSHSHEPLGTQ